MMVSPGTVMAMVVVNRGPSRGGSHVLCLNLKTSRVCRKLNDNSLSLSEF